jgi:hypothetical protein
MKKTLIGLGVAAALGVGASAQAFTIDPFTDVQILEVKDGSDAFSSVVGAGILGGNRDIFLDEITDTNAVPSASGTKIVVGGGQLAFSSDAGVTGTAVVQWDGANATSILDTTGLGSINMYAYGNAFVVETIFVDINYFLELAVYDSDGGYTIAKFATTGVGTEIIPFANLENVGLCGYTNPGANAGNPLASVVCGPGNNAVDMSKFSAGQFTINVAFNGQQSAAVDLTIGEIKVPEPGTLSLLGLGLLGASLPSLRRRRLSKAA